MSKSNLENLKSEIDELKAEIALRDAIVKHYAPDIDIDKALDDVTFNRHGEIVAYNPPASENDEGEGSEGEGSSEGQESNEGSGAAETGEGNGSSDSPARTSSVAAALKNRRSQQKPASSEQTSKSMADMALKERADFMRKEYPNAQRSTLARVGSTSGGAADSNSS